MKKRLLTLLLSCLLLAGCVNPALPQTQPLQNQDGKKFTATFLDVFDTVTTIVGYDESKAAFEEKTKAIHDELLIYHQLFDIYHTYEGITNLKDVNDAAGGEPVQVDPIIIDLLQDCKDYYTITRGKVNVAMGAILQLWHEAREAAMDDPSKAYLPEKKVLREAFDHTDLYDVVLDEAANTVQIIDPKLRLDVGAIAKGWAVQKVAEKAPSGLLISVGGNVCPTGPKDKTGTPWVVGITDPNGGDYLHTIETADKSVVTSGDYQRYFVVDGKMYHHIIDPGTLFPGKRWRSVTVVCDDSGLADALSTALFLLDYEQGLALLEQCDAEAFWIDQENNRYYSPGFRDLIRT